ncbi:DUF1572 domain-containing protein [Granulicella cerasi]|uniref:DUF1572 domain-containing protein n=1 Tax=Granulicella cerasi TaxID=741063 RepID=A0ABW1ZC14_9BACT|nr:DUF1572 domain-containing protein [Granulicella cerasi]
MSADANDLARTFIDSSLASLARSEMQIAKCLPRLSEEQMRHRGGEHENSVLNLLLHLEGNMRQWFIHGVGGQPDVRKRDSEFSLEPSISSAEAWRQLQQVIAESREVLSAVGAERLLETIDPQPTGTLRHPTVMAAIVKITEHLSHHAGQIILLTKQMAATDLDLSLPRKR